VFIHSSACRLLGCFHLLAFVNNVFMNGFCVDVHFISLGCITKSRISGSQVMLGLLWENCQTVFQNGGTILHSHQHMRVLISSCPYQNLLWFVFLIPAMLVGGKWYLIVALIYIFHLLAICISSLEKYLFKFSAYSFFFYKCVVFLLLSYKEFFYVLCTVDPYQIYDL
jgi:hypothetical protein